MFDRLQKVYETSSDPQRAQQALRLLPHFAAPELTRRALAYAASGKVKNQDALFLFTAALSNAPTRDVAWAYIRGNWPAVQAQLTELNGGRVVTAAGSFCSAQKATEVKDFFTAHPVHAAARALGSAESEINDCVQFRNEQEANLQSWLTALAR